MHTALTKVYIVIKPINAVLVQPHSLFPPTTNTWLGEIGTAVLPNHASGISPLSLTQELVVGRKAWTAGEAVPSLCPPTAIRFPLRPPAAEIIIGVSGSIFQTDAWVLLDW